MRRLSMFRPDPFRFPMTSLPITNPAPAPRETVFSYLSRLAATWRTQAPDLAYDMGASFKRFYDQDPDAFDALSDWAGLKAEQMDGLLSWTGVRSGEVRMTFRGEEFGSRALRNPVMRGCPICLREDTAGKDVPVLAAMVMRGDWQMREARVCVGHHHPLVPLWRAQAPQDRFDIGARLTEIAPDLLSGALDQPRVTPSDYDRWLDARLEDGRDDTALKEISLFAATTFCRLLGEALLQDDTDAQDHGVVRAHAAGFAVAWHGEAAIRAAFDKLAAASTGHQDRPYKAFGPIFPSLSRLYLNETQFDPPRRILRDCILDNWPVAPGTMILGQAMTERRRHSLLTAGEEFGVGSQVIAHFLIEAGAIPAQDDRPHSRILFDAQAHANMLSEIKTLVGPIAMRKAMGATKTELVALEDEGLLRPRTRVSKVKNPWRVADGTELVRGLLTGAVPVAADDIGWEPLLHARKRKRVSLRDLIALIRSGNLIAGQRAEGRGFTDIVVRKGDVDAFAERLIAKPEIHGVMSAAEFGRSIGLRGEGTLAAMIEADQFTAQRVLNPKTGRYHFRMTAEDIVAFQRRFVTVAMLARETGQHVNTVRTRLSAARVTPFAPGGQDFGLVYLRAEAAVAFQ